MPWRNIRRQIFRLISSAGRKTAQFWRIATLGQGSGRLKFFHAFPGLNLGPGCRIFQLNPPCKLALAWPPGTGLCSSTPDIHRPTEISFCLAAVSSWRTYKHSHANVGHTYRFIYHYILVRCHVARYIHTRTNHITRMCEGKRRIEYV